MNRLLFFICTLLFSNLGFSQSISEGARSMSQGSQNALTMTLGQTDAEEAEESWEKFIKNYKGKTKENKKTGEIFSDNCTMPAISSNTVDVYAKINQMGADAEIVAWYDLGGAYLSSEKHAAAYLEARAMLEKFSLNVSTQALQVKMEAQTDVLEDMQKDMDGLKKDQKGLEDEIAKCEKKIEDAKKGLEENASAQKAKLEEIKIQEGKVKAVKGKLGSMN